MTRLYPPYISQLINGSGGNNCGPASLAMTLAYRGVIPATQEAMLQCADIARDGLDNNVGETGGYVTLSQLATVASWYGQATWWPNSWSQVNASVEQGEPVIILLDNTVLQPRQYPVDPAWNAHHFILLSSTPEANNRYSNDPLSYYVGGPYFYTEPSTEQGVWNVGGVQALALTPLTPEPLPPEKIMLMEDWQIRSWVLADLYQWAGVAYNPDSGTAQAWVDALRGGTYLGRPRTEERPYGDGDSKGVWIEFDQGVLFYRLSDGAWSVSG